MIEHDLIKRTIEHQKGNLSRCAKVLNCTRNALYHRIGQSEELQQALKDTRASAVDEAESRLSALVGEDDLGAIKFTLLSKQGRERGYMPVNARDHTEAPIENTVLVEISGDVQRR